ncbi:MAG: hypothetical protein Q8P05_01115 [Candidatus Diapherotrites archaeon]|nr:hypothetical protein [Candidatus Diapherotrites archaeon]MDZ4256557.1 hypothetical protein [archaeon]
MIRSALRHPWLVLLLIALLAMMVRSVPFQFEGLVDPDAHFHARLSDNIASSQSLLEWDFLSMQGRVYSYPPLLHVLVGTLALLTGLSSLLVLKILGVLVGGLFVFAVYRLAHHLSQSQGMAVWSALFAGMTTIYAWRTAAFLRPDSLATLMIPFLLYLWVSRREIPALVGSVALVLLHPLSAVVYAFLLMGMLGVAMFRRHHVSLFLPLALVGMLLTFFLWIHSIGLPFSDYISPVSLDASELTPFWVLGIVLFFPFVWALGLAGLVKGKPHEYVLVWFFLAFIAAAFGMRLVNYLTPFLAILGGYGMMWVISHIHSLKRGLPILGGMMLLLGIVVVGQIMSAENPYVHPAEHAALTFIQTNTPSDAVILTIWDQGHVMTYYTKRPVVIDGYFEFAPDLDRRNAIMGEAFYSSNCQTVSHALQSFRATHLYLPQDELYSRSVELGLLDLSPCEQLSLVHSSEHARVYAVNG